MSDSDFSDPDDAIQPSKPSLMSSATIRLIVLGPDPVPLVKARLGGDLYPFTTVAHDTVVVVSRQGNTSKLTAAARREETILEIAKVDDVSSAARVVVNILSEEEPDSPVEKQSADGNLKIRLMWSLGDNPSHPRLQKSLSTVKKERAPAQVMEAQVQLEPSTSTISTPAATQATVPAATPSAVAAMQQPAKAVVQPAKAQPVASPPLPLPNASSTNPITLSQLESAQVVETQKEVPPASLGQQPVVPPPPQQPHHVPKPAVAPVVVAATPAIAAPQPQQPPPPASVPPPPREDKPAVEYDAVTLQTCVFLHVEVIKILKLKVVDPTTYVQISAQQGSDGTLSTSMSPVVKRNANPVYRYLLDAPVVIPKGAVHSGTTTVNVHVFEKKLVSAPQVLAHATLSISGKQLVDEEPLFTRQGKVFEAQCSGAGCSGDTKALIRVTLWASPVSLRHSLHPLTTIPFSSPSSALPSGILQFEITRAELRKEECPPGVYSAMATFHFGNGELQTERTLAVLNDFCSPLWMFKTHVPMRQQAIAVDLSIIRSNSLKKTEDTVAVCSKYHVFFGVSHDSSQWLETTLDLALAPSEAEKKEKSNDAGVLFVKYRTITVEALQQERDAKRSLYLNPIPTGDDDVGVDTESVDPALAAPRVLSKYSVKVTIAKVESLIPSAQTVRFPDSQLVLTHSGNKESRSGVALVSDGDVVVNHTLEAQIEPLFQVQQLAITNSCPASKGKVLGRGVADVDVFACHPNTPFLIPVTLEARHPVDGTSSDGSDEKNFAEDVTLLNRANRLHFGVVTLSVVVQRLDYWSNASVLNISRLCLVPTMSRDAYVNERRRKSRTLAAWFRNHRDFTIPRDHVQLIALDDHGTLQGALQMPTTFPLNARGQLAPLCIALLPENPAQNSDPLEDLQRTLSSLFDAVQQRVHTVDGLGVRTADEVEDHVFRAAQKEVAIHVLSYIEIDLTSTLMEAAKLSDDAHAIRAYVDVLRGATSFAGELPLAEVSRGQQQEWLLQCAGMWSGVSKQLRASSMPDLRIHGFEPLSERLWVIRARTAINSSSEFIKTSQQHRRLGADSGQSTGTATLEVHAMARDVVIPQPPHFEPIVSEVAMPLLVTAPSNDDTFSDRYHIAAFMFGPCHNSRTDVVLSVPAGIPVLSLKLDMLLRSGAVTTTVDAADGGSTSFTINCDWFHGNRGVSDKEERQRRKDLETEWRVSQQEPLPHNKLLVTFLGRSEHLEPPRLSGSTLTRCDTQALMVGGLGETSQPVNSIFSYGCRDGRWSEWVPSRITSWEARLGENWRKSSSFAVNPASFSNTSTTSYPATDANLVFNPRHGHSAAFYSDEQQLIIYGGIGPDGFDPASVTEDGYKDRNFISGKRFKRIVRYGYLGDVWVVDLNVNALRKVTPTMSASLAVDAPNPTPEASHHNYHHGLRWRHTSAVFGNSMFVLGGKTVVVKAVTVPYNMEDGSRRDDVVSSTQFQSPPHQNQQQQRSTANAGGATSNTTYFTAEEVSCTLETLSVLNLELMEWSVVHTTGAIPSPRYGHGSALVGSKLYLFGGRNAMETFNDLFVLDLKSLQWEELLAFGTLVPPPLDLFGFCYSVVENTGMLIVTGGRTVGAGSHHHAGATTDKLAVYYYNIATGFWRTLAFSCAPGSRRISPAICSISSNSRKQRPSSSSLKRLPFAFTPVLQILLVGGERGVVDTFLANNMRHADEGNKSTAPWTLDERNVLTSQEEGTYFDGNSVLPRPAGFPCVLNIAVDPGSSAIVPPNSRGGQERIENILCAHLRFRDATIPGWALEKSVNRLHTRAPSPAQPKPKKETPLTKQQQEAYLERLDADVDRRKKNQEQRMHDAYTEVREQASILVRDDVKQWGDEQWVSHYYRVYYKPAIRYARSRNLPPPKLPQRLQAALSEMAMQDEDEERYRLANSPKRQAREEQSEKERQSQESKKLLSAAEMSRVNAQLYYQPVAARKESNAKLHDSLLKPSRPQSARRVTKQDIEDSLSRLHRGPPSPLSSQKYGPTGRGAYSPAPRR